MSPTTLSNDELVDRLQELCVEVGQRLAGYVDADTFEEVIEGLTLAERVDEVTDCDAPGRDSLLNGLYWFERALKKKAARVRAESGSSRGSRAWQSFLAEHPELIKEPSEPVTRSGAQDCAPDRSLRTCDSLTPTARLEFTDEQLLVALADAPQWEAEQFGRALEPAVGAWTVTRVLRQRLGCDEGKVEHRHLMQVVGGLRRLEKAGLVVQETRSVYGQRVASDWKAAS